MDPQGVAGLPGTVTVSAPRDLTLEATLLPLLAAARRLSGADAAWLTEIVWDVDRDEATAAHATTDEGLPSAGELCRMGASSREALVDGNADLQATPSASALIALDDPARPWGAMCVATADGSPASPDQQAVVGAFADLIGQQIRHELAVRDELRAAARDRATLARHTSVLLAAERELLAPLTAARGWAATVLRPDLDGERRREAGRGLVAQLDVLWSRLNGLWSEAHLAVQGPVERSVIDLAATVRATIARHAPILGSHEVVIDADGPVEALGDVDVVADLLARLLDNINLHTPLDTRVDITVHADPPSVVVRDHGPGWPQPLPRTPLSTSRPLPLAGTGLFAATGMAESIGATLQAIDVDGAGVALQLTLATVDGLDGWAAGQ